MALRSYVDAVVPSVAELVPPPDMSGHGPGLEDVAWPVPVEEDVLEVDVVELVCAEAKLRDVRAASTAIVMTAVIRMLLLSVLNLRLISFSPPRFCGRLRT